MVLRRLPPAGIIPLVFAIVAALSLASLAHAQSTGAIEGRVTNPNSGTVLERTHITVEGTTLEAFADEDGYYRLEGVPAGTARVRAFFSGFPSVSADVAVTANDVVQHDFQLSPGAAQPAVPNGPIKLEEFVVSTSREMSAAALAINEQRFAPNMKNVVATDEFGDIAEGNVAEFLKFMPGVNIDNAGGNLRDVSLNGVPSAYVPVTLDGFGLASAVGGGSGGTGRNVGMDQVSINNLSRIEVSFSPTPDSPGNALAGTVNLIPRSSFERTRPLFNYNAYFMMRDEIKKWGDTPAPHHPTQKIKPGMDISYVVPVNKKFGFTLSAGFNAQYSGEPQIQNTWRGVQSPTNGTTFPNTTPDKPYLTSVLIRNSGKDTHRSSFGFTTDYRLTRTDRFSVSFTYSTFDVHTNHNMLTFDVGKVNPGDFSLDFTRGAPGQGTLTLGTNGDTRSNWTFMPSIIWRHDGPIWKMDSGLGYSRAANRNRCTESGFFDTTTAKRTGVTINFADIFYLRPNTITVTDTSGQPVDPYSLSNYVVTAAGGNTRSTDDYKRTAYANLRRDFAGEIPFSLRTGVDFRGSTRDQRFSAPNYTYVGRDGAASTTLTPTSDDQAAPFLDPSFSDKQPHYGFPKFQGISSELLYNDFAANPSHFTSNANTTYRNLVNNSKYAEEWVSAGYLRTDAQFFHNRLKLVGGVRAEQTNVKAEGPLTDPTLNEQRDASGKIILVNNKPVLIVPTSNALGVSQLTFIDRGAHVRKEYLRLFPSINASYNVRENLIARMAWYTSIGRPDFNQYSGGLTLPDPETPTSNDVISLSNASIKPWTARTLNARIEYYLQGVGEVELGAFRRDFKNFFGNTTLAPSPQFLEDYNLDPNVYGNYPVVTTYNLDSTVRMQGLTFGYKQALTFLPHWARGVQVFGNASVQRILGPTASANFNGFIPRTFNWGVSLTRERYTLRANWNYRSLQRRAAIASGLSIEPGTYTWWSKRLYLDLNGDYRLTRHVALFASLRNFGDTPEDIKIFGPHTPKVARFRERIEYGSLWSFGVKGTF